MESYPGTIAALATTGLLYPREAGVLAVVWSVGAIGFARGYATGEPAARYTGFYRLGSAFRLASLAATAASVFVVYKLIANK